MKLLKEKPQKDGLSTKYLCGYKAIGTWSTRLKKYEEFINTRHGKYILLLERKEALLDRYYPLVKQLKSLALRFRDEHEDQEGFQKLDEVIYKLLTLTD